MIENGFAKQPVNSIREEELKKNILESVGTKIIFPASADVLSKNWLKLLKMELKLLLRKIYSLCLKKGHQ